MSARTRRRYDPLITAPVDRQEEGRLIVNAPGSVGLTLTLIAVLALHLLASPIAAQECEWIAVGGGPPRADHAMAYDSRRGVTVLFGGDAVGVKLRDTWEWDGREWSLATMNGPEPRSGHGMAFDESRGVTVLFGGEGESSLFGDTWEWDGQTWTRILASGGPPPCPDQSMVYDSDRRRSVLHQGGLGYMKLWEWDGEHWLLLADPAPFALGGSNLAYDSRRRILVMCSVGETWEWDTVEWRRVSPEAPSHSNHVMAFDTRRGVSVLYGGSRGGNPMLDETWIWDGVDWMQEPVTGAGRCARAAMVYDTRRHRMVLDGGYDGRGLRLDAWEYSCPPPIRLSIDATCPGGGPIRIAWDGATPRGRVALVFGRSLGETAVPHGYACAGTLLGLRGGLRLVAEAMTGAGGQATIVASARAEACGGSMQLVDLSTCATSNVARIE